MHNYFNLDKGYLSAFDFATFTLKRTLPQPPAWHRRVPNVAFTSIILENTIKKVGILHRFSVLLGSLVHDLGHPGVTNAFLITTDNELALQYNDQHVLEMYHVAEAFRVLRKPGSDMLSS